MSGERETFDEDLDNPFDLMSSLGLHLCEEDDEDEDEDELDDDVYWANLWIVASSLGDWAQFADGLSWDGTRNLTDESEIDEISLMDHVHLVLNSQREERRNSQL